MALRKYSKEWLQELCANSYSYSEVLRKTGRHGGGSFYVLKNKIKEYEIDVSHFTPNGRRPDFTPNERHSNETKKKKSFCSREKYKLKEIFKKNSPVTQKVLRGYVERHGIIEYVCNKCGCDGNWQNERISLELEHIDGDKKNNDPSNLIYLCPNCHALTKTYRGRNKALRHQAAKNGDCVK